MGSQSLWALRLALGTHGYSQTLPVPFCHPGGMTGARSSALEKYLGSVQPPRTVLQRGSRSSVVPLVARHICRVGCANADREGHQEPASARKQATPPWGTSVSGDVLLTLTTVELRDGLGVSQFGIRKRSRRWVGK